MTNINTFQGNVGVGTNAPLADLDVNGNIKSRGNLYLAPGTLETNTKVGANDTFLLMHHNTFTGDLGPNHPLPECGTIMTNRSGGGTFPWLMYTGLVKDVAATTPATSLRMDWGQGSSTGSATNLVDATLNPLMTLRFSGELGIGTNNPQEALHVAGSIRLGAAEGVDDDNLRSIVTTSPLEVHSNAEDLDGLGVSLNLRSGFSDSESNIQMLSSKSNSTFQYISFATATTERMRITAAGNVGIGTTNPASSILDVAGTLRVGTDSSGLINIGRSGNVANFRLGYLYHDGTNMQLLNQEDGGLHLGTNNGNKLIIESSGNVVIDTNTFYADAVNNRVGIGTATPRAKLDIYTGSTTAAGLILDRYATGNYRTELYQGSNGLDIKVGHASHEPASVVHVERFSTTNTRLRIASPGNLRTDGGVEVGNYNDITDAKMIWDTGGRFRIYTDGTSMFFSSAGGNGTLAATTALSMHNGNKVGIGTTSASRTLSVNGSFMADIGGGKTFGTTGTSAATPNDTTGSSTTKHNATFFMSLSRYTTATNRPIYFGSGDDSDTTVVIGTTGGAGGAGFQNTMLKLTGSGYLYAKRVYGSNTQLSDDRLKINEEPIQNATKTILKLNPLVYDKYEKLSDITSNVFEVESGLMVQDIWYDTPELRHMVDVPDDANPSETKEEDPEYTNWGSNPAYLTYTHLLPYIVKSIQEIHNENGKLKIQISGAHSPNMIVCRSPTTDTVSLCNKEYDSTCIGVLSDTNSSEVLIETRGLGYIWVVNTNGNLTPGDYITTSNVSGYGQKQNSEFLANYTVAKILEPCDFTDIYKPVKRIIQQLEDVNYYGTTKNILVNEEIYNTLPENERHMETCTSLEDENTTTDYYKILYTESKYNREGAETITRQELVNVLDEHGQIQWEDHATETEKAYKIRYLDANGVITDEANVVHTAAFVGCTYNCG
jgi:hypothetical protein